MASAGFTSARGAGPALISVIIRHIDRMRSDGEPPARRHYDAPAIAAEHDMEHPPTREEQK